MTIPADIVEYYRVNDMPTDFNREREIPGSVCYDCGHAKFVMDAPKPEPRNGTTQELADTMLNEHKILMLTCAHCGSQLQKGAS